MKECSKCNKEQPLSSFGVFKSKGKEYLRGRCNTCRSNMEKKARKENLEVFKERDRKKYIKAVKKDKEGLAAKYKNTRLKKMYGVTLQEFEDMALKLNYKCEICKQKNKVHKDLVIDHNHNTGGVRGLLCSQCNSALGLLKDSPEVLSEALKYLLERGYYGR